MSRRAPTVIDYLYAPASLSREAIYAEIEHLRAYGTPASDVAARLGLDREVIRKWAKQDRRPDITELLKEETK